MSHRQWRWLATLVPSAALLLLALIPENSVAAAPLTPRQQALHVLDRLAFGPRPGDVDRVLAVGVDRYIDQQLHPETIPEAPEVAEQLAAMTTLDLDPAQILASDVGLKPDVDGVVNTDAKLALHNRRDQIEQEAIEQRVLRATASTRQLQEVMVDFWFNHFNVFCCEYPAQLQVLVGSYEQRAIRPYVLGKFRDLLGATAHHPAMLVYLDNTRNAVHADRDNAGGDAAGLNENYARELMELHTLGVDGGYTQDDVMALARILSGWRLPPAKDLDDDGHGFYFDAASHAPGDKRFLGRTISAGGESEGEEALDMLARSPATAHHIAFELAQYFVSDDPDPALVAMLAKRFLDSDGDIGAVLNALFHSDPFWQAANDGNKFKTPYQFVVSALRATGQPVFDDAGVAQIIAKMGERIYGMATPDGYKNTADAWLSPDAVTDRAEFAIRLASGAYPFLRPPSQQQGRGQPADAGRLQKTLDGLFTPHTLAVAGAASGPMQSALLLSAPEFMMR